MTWFRGTVATANLRIPSSTGNIARLAHLIHNVYDVRRVVSSTSVLSAASAAMITLSRVYLVVSSAIFQTTTTVQLNLAFPALPISISTPCGCSAWAVLNRSLTSMAPCALSVGSILSSINLSEFAKAAHLSWCSTECRKSVNVLIRLNILTDPPVFTASCPGTSTWRIKGVRAVPISKPTIASSRHAHSARLVILTLTARYVPRALTIHLRGVFRQ